MKMKIIKKVLVIILISLFLLVIVDKLTTYTVPLGPSSVKTSTDDDIIIEMSSGTSLGYFKEAKLKKIEDGVYRIDAYFSLLRGEYSGYYYVLENPDNYIKELRNYSYDNPTEYKIIYKKE